MHSSAQLFLSSRGCLGYIRRVQNEMRHGSARDLQAMSADCLRFDQGNKKLCIVPLLARVEKAVLMRVCLTRKRTEERMKVHWPMQEPF